MATAENPFPEKKSSKKQSYVAGIYNTVGGSAAPTQTPLYYDDTIRASLQIVQSEGEMSFDNPVD